MSDSLWPHGLQHARLACPSPTPRPYSDSCPLSWLCHPTISSSVIPFSSCLQSFPASGSFQMSQFFTSRGQSIGVSASASVLPIDIQDWLPLGWTGWIFLQSKGLSVVFSNTNFCIYNCTSPFVWTSLTSDAWHSYPTYWVDIRIQAYTYMGNVIKQTGFFFPILCYIIVLIELIHLLFLFNIAITAVYEKRHISSGYFGLFLATWPCKWLSRCVHLEMHMVHWEVKWNLGSVFIYIEQIKTWLDCDCRNLNAAYMLSVNSSLRTFRQKRFSYFCQSDIHFHLKMWKYS